MPRDASGTYTRPAGQPVTANTLATASVFNALTSDLAVEMTDSVSRTGKGVLTGQLKAADGTVAAPGIAFGSDLDCGWYHIGANDIALAVGGVKVLEALATAIKIPLLALLADGTSGAPALAFTSQPTTGIFLNAAGDLRVMVAGTQVAKFTIVNGIEGTGTTSAGVSGSATTGNGVQGAATSGNAGAFGATSGYGVSTTGNATKAPIHMTPQSAPSTVAAGDIFPDSNGRLFAAIGGSTFVPAGAGVCFDRDYNAVGNVGVGEDDLLSATLPANYLTGTFRLEHNSSGSTANNANAKTLKLYFGGTAVLTCVLTTGIAADWIGSVSIIRTGVSTQRYIARVDEVNQATGAVKAFVAQGTLAITETATIAIKATATATSNNDVVQNTYSLTAL